MSLPTDSKQRKATPIYSGVIKHFPLALAAMAQGMLACQKQHGIDSNDIEWVRDKSTDHLDSAARHLCEAGTLDKDGVSHSTKLAIRALMNLQIEEEAKTEPVHMHYWLYHGSEQLKCYGCGEIVTPASDSTLWGV
jgi:hypothetical protein